MQMFVSPAFDFKLHDFEVKLLSLLPESTNAAISKNFEASSAEGFSLADTHAILRNLRSLGLVHYSPDSEQNFIAFFPANRTIYGEAFLKSAKQVEV